MTKLTREWVQKAEADWAIVQLALASGETPLPRDPICFHCQQVVEKYLKALLQEIALPIPFTHNLEIPLASLFGTFPSLVKLRRGLRFLTDYAVDARYPGRIASTRQMESALRWAARIRQQCRDLLGIKPPKPRKKP